MIRRYWKLGAVALSCAALGAGASVIASAGAATSGASPSTASSAHTARAGLGARRLLARAVNGEVVVATKSGFATVTINRGTVRSVNGQQLTLSDGTKKSTYKTVTLTIPANAHVRDNGKKASLSDLTASQRATVIQGPKNTLVIARDVNGGH